MGIIEEIKSLATTIGTDVKALRNDKANKNDFDRVVTALNNIADGLKGNTSNNQAGANTNVATNSGTVSESFAQRVVKELIKNHYPYLKSEEDNFSEFVKFMKSKSSSIGRITYSPKVSFDGDVLTVEIESGDYKSVNVNYTINGENHKEIITGKKSFIGIDSFKYRECDYYGVYGDEPQKIIHLDSYRKQMEHPEKYIFEYNGGSEIIFNKITDNMDYSFLNLTDSYFYSSLAKHKIKEMDTSKNFVEDIQHSIRSFELNGTVKVAIIDSNKSTDFGFENLSDVVLKSKPKYLAIIGQGTVNDSNTTILNQYIEVEGKYNSSESPDTWNERDGKVRKTKTAIYRWDESQNKYMFESADTLEDWLKTHPIDTL